jgi:hypothetical protein
MAKIRLSKRQEQTLALIAAGGEMQTTYDKKKRTVIVLNGKEINVPYATLTAILERGLIEQYCDRLPIRYWKLTTRGKKRASTTHL